MIYACSDLHGYPMDEFLRLLDKAGFSNSDYLFVLGDVIDRNGDGGIAMLQWMMLQPNVQMLLGNHEAMLLSCNFLFDEVTDANLARLSALQINMLNDWLFNGAKPTLDSLYSLRKKDPEALADILDYIQDAPLYDMVTAGSRDFLLVHAGLGHFDKKKPLSSYSSGDLIWYRPSPDERFFDDVFTILGHTPTAFYGHPGQMFQTPTWADIDVGAGGGQPPMLLRLDDMQPFYARE